MCADFVELPKHTIDVILGMDCLHSCYACMDCRSKVVRFCFPNKVELVREKYNSSRPNPLISKLQANKIMY